MAGVHKCPCNTVRKKSLTNTCLSDKQKIRKCIIKVINEIVTYFENLLHINIRCEPCCRINISVVVPAKRKCIKILISSYILEIRVLIYKVNSLLIKTYAALTVDITGILAVRTCKYIIKIISRLAY